MSDIEAAVADAIERRRLVRVLAAPDWEALTAAMECRAIMPFPPAFQLKQVHVAEPWPPRFEPAKVSYLGDYREGLLPYVAVEWVRIMTWAPTRNPRYAKYSRWRHEGPSRRWSCEAALMTLLETFRLPFTLDGTGCVVISAFTPTASSEK
jgi:hypothetical protein